jgi:probable F420-dependent oxidoreductase
VAIRVGLGLFTGQIPSGSDRTFEREYADTLELARLAERTGFDSVWVSEHHGSSDGYLPSLLTFLAAIAGVTERVALGTGVVLAPLHDPLRLAEDAAVVDQLSGGRLVLGLGAGWREEEFRMFGVPIAERGIRTEETVEILRRAWTGRRFSFQGRAYRYDAVRVTPPPARKGGPPILLGGYADPVVRRAGRIADGHITDDAGHEELARYLELLDEGAREAERDPGEIRLALMVNVVVGGDEAWALARPGMDHQLGAYEAWGNGADTPATDELVPVPPAEDELLATTPHGEPEEIAAAFRARLAPLAERRDVELVVRLHYPGMELEPAAEMVERFGREIAPALRSSP